MTGPTPRDDVAALEGYHSPQVDVEVRLNTNECPWPPPTGFSQRVAAAVEKIAWNRYPDRGAQALRSGIGELHGVSAEQVFAANGSNEVLQTLLLAYAGSSRSVVTFEPTYALHSHIARIVGASVVSGTRRPDFTLDVDLAVELVAQNKPAITFLCSPNNPTGVVEAPDTVRVLLNEVENFGGMLVVDEAYAEFAPWSAVELLPNTKSLVVTRTFSKTWAMAAARLGYLLADESVVEQLQKVVLPYHLDAATQAAGLAALDFFDAKERRVADIVAGRAFLEDGLTSAGATVWPSGANFVLFRPPADGDLVWKRLVSRSVLVRNTSSWSGLEGCLRVTVGTEEENTRFLDAFKEVLATEL